MSGASLRPTDFAAGGGLVDDIIATITHSRFETYDYNGTVQNPVLALHITLEDEDGNTHEQYYAAGDLKYFVPSKDGARAEPVGQKTALSASSNAFLFISSVVDSGFDPEKLSDDVSVFEGLRAHFIRVAQPKRDGLPNTGQQGGREKTILIMDRLEEAAPAKGAKGGAKAGAKAGAAKPATKATNAKAAAAPAAADGDDDDALVDIVQTLILENDGKLEKKKIAAAVFKAAKEAGNDAKVSAAMSKQAFEDAFLGADGRPWEFDGAVLTM